MSTPSLSDRLSTVQYTVHSQAHIQVDGQRCRDCDTHPCLNFCPARCFTRGEAGGIDYYYAGCVECGTCLLLCRQEAVRWDYPAGGFGVAYRF